MSSEIGLNDVKPGMWVEFDDADGHYAGELHEMKNPESMVDVLIMSMGHKPPLYIETEDEGNLVVFLDFGDGYSTGSARNVHVYESKPETESVKQAEDDDKKPFWKGKTCKEMAGLHIKVTFKNGDVATGVTDKNGDIKSAYVLTLGMGDDLFVPKADIESIELADDAFRERITDITKVRPGDKVVVKNGNEYTVKKTDSDRMGGQTLCLSIGELGFPDGWWMDDSFFQYAYRGPYTMDDLPKEPGFYKARTESVWKHDGKRWMPVLSHDGTIAPAFPCQSQSRSQFFKTSVRDDRFPFTKVEASFE
ncbi:hypothetical protein PMR98_06680 [Bifidobacterium longum]|uniref:hypothetical protein n=1 Tax=Bifidobacterium longum TaxID=216816 RepID=UPI002972D85F|nr:hypothetical protein [Bifidobacterium longum]MDB6598497.1 hypothetical protein [Bifidobacterium longum]MDB6600475.1 hypothetical protein [Bifidobacterium longum]MDB6795197.1 hypothetical protein [Bifidobacterium longum]MDB6797170.1 hypothetical protein [Bifidobacterium longum]MDB6799111.1 hypothetical protein [Bifidobacterium longum]